MNNENVFLAETGSLAIGIDLGTSTVSAALVDLDRKETLEVYSLPHSSYLSSGIRSEQSASVIMDMAERLLSDILAKHPDVVSIGITGQMHGIVYIDGEGRALSPLINWQDKRADQPLSDGRSACERMEAITGEAIAAGYGIATHYYHLLNGLVPQDAVSFCSIMDLFAMRICHRKSALIHTSVAASFGMFGLREGRFMQEKLALLGINEPFLPRVTEKSCVIGYCRGIPVSVAIGDNQASFLGSVRENGASLLINVGTGSQISAVSDYRALSSEVELRPFIEGKYLICGASLCGGSAYALLEGFFRSYLSSAGHSGMPQYDLMNELATQAYDAGEEGLAVDVSFFGKRSDPTCRGAISLIDSENFTPPSLALGVLKGICNDLFELYRLFPEKRAHIVASGGAVRKNALLVRLMADRFGIPISVSVAKEEAASGVALFSALACEKIRYENGFADYVYYH